MTHAVLTPDTEVAKRFQDAYGMELSVLQVKEIHLLRLHPLRLLLHPLCQIYVAPSPGQTNARTQLTVSGLKAIVYRRDNFHITIFYAHMQKPSK